MSNARLTSRSHTPDPDIRMEFVIRTINFPQQYPEFIPSGSSHRFDFSSSDSGRDPAHSPQNTGMFARGGCQEWVEKFFVPATQSCHPAHSVIAHDQIQGDKKKHKYDIQWIQPVIVWKCHTRAFMEVVIEIARSGRGSCINICHDARRETLTGVF